MRSTIKPGIGLLSILAVLSASESRATEHDRIAPESPGAVTVEASASEGLPAVVHASRAYIDPVTGQLTGKPQGGRRALRISPEELRALSTSHRNLKVETAPDGARRLRMNGGFRHFAVVGDGGKPRCLGGEVFVGSDVSEDVPAPAHAATHPGCDGGKD